MSKVPHIANLRVRATRLGYLITKAADNSVTGYNEYVLHTLNETWQFMQMLSLHGIAHQIAELERAAGIDEHGIPYAPEPVYMLEDAIEAQVDETGIPYTATSAPIGDNTDLTADERRAIAERNWIDAIPDINAKADEFQEYWDDNNSPEADPSPIVSQPAKVPALISPDGSYRIMDALRMVAILENNGLAPIGLTMNEVLRLADAIRAYEPEKTL